MLIFTNAVRSVGKTFLWRAVYMLTYKLIKFSCLSGSFCVCWMMGFIGAKSNENCWLFSNALHQLRNVKYCYWTSQSQWIDKTNTTPHTDLIILHKMRFIKEYFTPAGVGIAYQLWFIQLINSSISITVFQDKNEMKEWVLNIMANWKGLSRNLK